MRGLLNLRFDANQAKLSIQHSHLSLFTRRGIVKE